MAPRPTNAYAWPLTTTPQSTNPHHSRTHRRLSDLRSHCAEAARGRKYLAPCPCYPCPPLSSFFLIQAGQATLNALIEPDASPTPWISCMRLCLVDHLIIFSTVRHMVVASLHNPPHSASSPVSLLGLFPSADRLRCLAHSVPQRTSDLAPSLVPQRMSDLAPSLRPAADLGLHSLATSCSRSARVLGRPVAQSYQSTFFAISLVACTSSFVMPGSCAEWPASSTISSRRPSPHAFFRSYAERVCAACQ